MIDASKGFMKDGPKNRLRSQDIHKIVDVFTKQIELTRYSRMVPLSEIADSKNDFNLNISRYIDSSDPEDIQDLHAHLHGGIPERDINALSALLGCLPTAPLAAVQAEPARLQRPSYRRDRCTAGGTGLGGIHEVRQPGRAHDQRMVHRTPPSASSHHEGHPPERPDRRVQRRSACAIQAGAHYSTSTTYTSS